MPTFFWNTKASPSCGTLAFPPIVTYHLYLALVYCAVISAVNSFYRAPGYVHITTLVGMGLKRRLFQLAYRHVNANPKDAMEWFAIGSYY